MRILVTGGTGLIARHWMQTRPDDNFTVLSRQIQPPNLGAKVDFISNLDQLPSLDGFNAVVNLAGEPIVDKRWSQQRKRVLRDSRLQTTSSLLQLLAKSERKPSHFLSGSAIGIYGDTGAGAADEQCEITVNGNDFAQTLCADWEALALTASQHISVTLLRTGIVLSNQGGALKKMLPLFKAGLGGRLGRGDQFMSWVHISDVAAILNHLLSSAPYRGPVNVTAPNAVTNKEFTRALAQACARPACLPVPQLAMKLTLGEASQLLFDSQNIRPGVLLNQQFNFKFKDIDSALSDLI